MNEQNEQAVNRLMSEIATGEASAAKDGWIDGSKVVSEFRVSEDLTCPARIRQAMDDYDNGAVNYRFHELPDSNDRIMGVAQKAKDKSSATGECRADDSDAISDSRIAEAEADINAGRFVRGSADELMRELLAD